MLFHKKNQVNFGMDEEYEMCVLCGAITDVPKSEPLELRSDYLPGAGQLCHECAIQNVNEERTAMRNGFAYALPLYEKKG